MKTALLPVSQAWYFVRFWFVAFACLASLSFASGAKTSVCDELEEEWNAPLRFHCPATAPELPAGHTLKVMTWNVQFMTGGVYNFWDGPEAVPMLQVELQKQVAGKVSQVIRDEKPDVVLLQEVDRDTRVGMDQIQWLMDELGDIYPCYSATAYSRLNQNLTLPERKRPAEQNLVTLSRFQMGTPRRHDLARIPERYVVPMSYQRAMLEVPVKTTMGHHLHVINLHTDASFARNTGISEKQIAQIDSYLEELESKGIEWLAGGDFNALPPGQYELLNADSQSWYEQKSPLETLSRKYPMVPSVADATGSERHKWLTQILFEKHGLDQTLDYIFYSPRVPSINGYVLQEPISKQALSDHTPVVVEFALPSFPNHR
ncbi:endonuclease/exonuclease/phosphatase family protein [Sansalvadorimonas verongulae]|uniref:endonuclease/exonuclease/phosphatase family protein n=1 Tax=Sansalvadorimonas verongulae TaxID=2172824 RepID=UPI0012BD42D9|nr:endonuclease/exonuclease/phosphatase family protein [Sansalvadorimonas verongulae]MTI14192.1 hypothetical protein [Sansalvadorimonas verongulae]